jgi:hypothetical protein
LISGAAGFGKTTLLYFVGVVSLSVIVTPIQRLTRQSAD